MFNIIKESKDLQYEFEVLKDKMKCKDNKAFKKVNKADVIELDAAEDSEVPDQVGDAE